MLQDQVGVKRVRMSEHEVAAALTTYSLRGQSANSARPKQPKAIIETKAPRKIEELSSGLRQHSKAVATKKASAQPKPKPSKRARTLSLDADVLAFFTAGGRGASSRINAALRLAMDLATALQPQSLAQA